VCFFVISICFLLLVLGICLLVYDNLDCWQNRANFLLFAFVVVVVVVILCRALFRQVCYYDAAKATSRDFAILPEYTNEESVVKE